jgi:hypothetical protein
MLDEVEEGLTAICDLCVGGVCGVGVRSDGGVKF